MKPTEILEHEHRIITLVLDGAEREAQAVAAGGAVDTDRISKILDFVRNFADRCHHGKEENVLFAKLGERGFPKEYGPIGVMLHEHDLGREYIRTAAAALPAAGTGDADARRQLAAALAGYVELLRAHIHKENTVLFPMAEEALTPADKEELIAAFERVEREEMGEGIHERYHQLAHELGGH